LGDAAAASIQLFNEEGRSTDEFSAYILLPDVKKYSFGDDDEDVGSNVIEET
jgi:hypothetical protein